VTTIRVLTYNIHHGEGNDRVISAARIAEVIRESGADLVGLNEVHHPALLPGDERAFLARIAEAAGMGYVFGAALPQEDGWAFPAPYGNALLARWPLLNAATGLLPGAPGCEVRGSVSAQVGGAQVGGAEAGGAQLGGAEAGGPAGLVCYVTHLENRDEALRVRQAQRLLGLLAAERRAHLVIGDFNAVTPGEERGGQVPSSAPGLLRAAGYVDAAQAAGAVAPTCPSARPAERIDYVWLSPALAGSLRGCQVWDTPLARVASDHLPVLAALEV